VPDVLGDEVPTGRQPGLLEVAMSVQDATITPAIDRNSASGTDSGSS
jgi:hypothetical protein